MAPIEIQPPLKLNLSRRPSTATLPARMTNRSTCLSERARLGRPMDGLTLTTPPQGNITNDAAKRGFPSTDTTV